MTEWKPAPYKDYEWIVADPTFLATDWRFGIAQQRWPVYKEHFFAPWNAVPIRPQAGHCVEWP
jgi:hypothetical protein